MCVSPSRALESLRGTIGGARHDTEQLAAGPGRRDRRRGRRADRDQRRRETKALPVVVVIVVVVVQWRRSEAGGLMSRLLGPVGGGRPHKHFKDGALLLLSGTITAVAIAPLPSHLSLSCARAGAARSAKEPPSPHLAKNSSSFLGTSPPTAHPMEDRPREEGRSQKRARGPRRSLAGTIAAERPLAIADDRSTALPPASATHPQPLT